MSSVFNVEVQSSEIFDISMTVNWQKNSQPDVSNQSHVFKDEQYYKKCVVQEEEVSDIKCIYNVFIIY